MEKEEVRKIVKEIIDVTGLKDEFVHYYEYLSTSADRMPALKTVLSCVCDSSAGEMFESDTFDHTGVRPKSDEGTTIDTILHLMEDGKDAVMTELPLEKIGKAIYDIARLILEKSEKDERLESCAKDAVIIYRKLYLDDAENIFDKYDLKSFKNKFSADGDEIEALECVRLALCLYENKKELAEEFNTMYEEAIQDDFLNTEQKEELDELEEIFKSEV